MSSNDQVLCMCQRCCRSLEATKFIDQLCYMCYARDVVRDVNTVEDIETDDQVDLVKQSLSHILSLDTVFRHSHKCHDDNCKVHRCTELKKIVVPCANNSHHTMTNDCTYEQLLSEHEAICNGDCDISGCMMMIRRSVKRIKI